MEASENPAVKTFSPDGHGLLCVGLFQCLSLLQFSTTLQKGLQVGGLCRAPERQKLWGDLKARSQ